VHVLDIGQADAVILELPSGRLAVIDFGHDYLLDYLDRLDPERVRRYAFCLLTHAHNDHYACVEEFIRRHDRRVEEYWFSFASTGGIPALDSFRRAALHRRRGRLLVLDTPRVVPHRLEADLEAVRFAPQTSEVLRDPRVGDATAENNRSVVLLLRYGQAVLLCGADAEERRWADIAEQARASDHSLQAHLIKAAHHGAAPPYGLPPLLWRSLLHEPHSFVALTVGRRNGKPDRATLDALRSRACIRCTGRSQTCRLLPRSSDSGRDTTVDGGLIAQVLAPAWERQAVPSCFGTQVYDLDRDGAVTLRRANRPAFLDACLPQPPTCSPL
jgi:hypothetical protein